MEEQADQVPLEESLASAIEIVPVSIVVDHRDDEGGLYASTNIPIKRYLTESLELIKKLKGDGPTPTQTGEENAV